MTAASGDGDSAQGDDGAATTTGGELLNLQLAGMILGGLCFGVLGDKRGRLGRSLAERDALAAPEGRLFFAGEACSHDDAATVHGAYASGEAAAKAVLAG